MKKVIYGVLTLLILVTCNANALIAQSLNNFDKILLTGNISVLLVEGETPSLDIKNNADQLEYELNGQTLKLSSTELIKYNKTPTVKVVLTYTNLREIKARAGAAAFSDNTIETEVLKLRFSSGASGELTITSNTLEVGVSEGGTLKLRGTTTYLEAKAATGGTLSAYQLDSEKTIVKANTGGSAKVIALESIDASANTGGSIAYKGDPKKVRMKDGLSGSVKGF